MTRFIGEEVAPGDRALFFDGQAAKKPVQSVVSDGKTE